MEDDERNDEEWIDEHALAEALERKRPKTRGDCFRVPRPCPYISCRYHLYLDIDGKGHVKVNTKKSLDEMEETCALDAAGRTSRTLEDVAALLSVTRERVRQIEQAAVVRLRVIMSDGVFSEDEEAVGELERLLKVKE